MEIEKVEIVRIVEMETRHGEDDTIEIYMNEKWMVFEHRNGEVPE